MKQMFFFLSQLIRSKKTSRRSKFDNKHDPVSKEFAVKPLSPASEQVQDRVRQVQVEILIGYKW